jgi:hypothetical protein
MSENEESPTREDAPTPPPSPETASAASAPEAPSAPSAPTAEPKPKDWRAIAIMAGYGLLAILLIWQTVALSRVSKGAAEELNRRAAAKLVAVDDARKIGGEHSASALASGLHQLFLLRSQYPEISDRTFQAVCAELAATQSFDLAVVTDSNQRILASSDLKLVGQTYPMSIVGAPTSEKQDGKWVVTAPVKSQEATLGAVVLRLN